VLLSIPVLYPLIVSSLYYQDTAIERPTLVVDLDNSAMSRSITRDLDGTMGLRVDRRLASLEEGREQLLRGQTEMLVVLPADLSTRVKRGESVSLDASINAANILTYGVAFPAISSVVAAWNERLSREFLMKRMGPSAGNRSWPLRVDTSFLYHPTLSYGRFLVLGIMLLVLQQLMLIGLSFSVGFQRELGLLRRGPGWTVALWARWLAQTGFYLAALGFIAWVVLPGFGWVQAPPWRVAVVMVLFLVAMGPWTILLASFARDRYSSFQTLMFLSVPMLMMSGFLWPFDMMPQYVRALASVFPATPALQALRIVGTRGADLSVASPMLLHMGIQTLAGMVVVSLWLYFTGRWDKTSQVSEPSASIPEP